MTADKKRDTLLLNLERLSKWHEHECLVADDQKAWFHHNAAASFITAAIQRIEQGGRDAERVEELEGLLIECASLDANIVVPERDYSTMTPKDIYEAGLVDGGMGVRDAIRTRLWDERILGASEQHVRVASIEESAIIDAALKGEGK